MVNGRKLQNSTNITSEFSLEVRFNQSIPKKNE